LPAEQPVRREISPATSSGGRSGPSRTKPLDSVRCESAPSSPRGRLAQAVRKFAQVWQSGSLVVARGLVLLSLVYAAWRYGATEAITQFHLCILLGVATLLTLTSRRGMVIGSPPLESQQLPLRALVLGLLWVAYAAVQASPFSPALGSLGGGTTLVQDQFAAPAVACLQDAWRLLDEGVSLPNWDRFASVVPHQTRQAMIPFMLAFAMMMLSAVLFDSRKLRTAFLWILVMHTALLAAWGIIQRAGGDAWILPGVQNTYSGVPFASFVYKNAGAAALLPALAAIGALFYGSRSGRPKLSASRGSFRARSGCEAATGIPSFGSSSLAFLVRPRSLTLLALAGLLATGLIASLSRGAWMTAILAAVLAWGASRLALSTRKFAVVILSLVCLIASVVALTGIRDTITERAEEVSVARLSGDQRWEHWKDGARAAWHYLPAGSGLGTYGFATLPHQTGPRRSWFREAHNQYLEILTESGIVGIGLLLSAMVWFSMTTWRLLRQDEQREKSSWGLLGLVILICGSVQSLFDFVLMIPANLLLYASLMGIVAGTERAYAASIRSAQHRPAFGGGWLGDPIRKAQTQRSVMRMPALWCLIAMALLAYAGLLSRRQAHVDQRLSSLREGEAAEQPTPEQLSRGLAILAEAIEVQPLRADLYRRAAHWSFAVYRLQILQAAAAKGDRLAWKDTAPESLSSALVAMDETTQLHLRSELLATPQLRRQLADVLKRTAQSLRRNPLDPVVYMHTAYLAPLTGMPVEPWVNAGAKLNQNDVRLMYSNGLIADQHGLADMALDQWSKSLAVSPRYLDRIFHTSHRKYTPVQLAQHIVPRHRTDLLVRLVRDADQRSPMMGVDVGEELIAYLQQAVDFNEGNRQAALAGIQQVMGDRRAAIEHWQQAVQCDPRNPDYRWALADALRQEGGLEQALQQAILGGTLHPSDERFSRLTLLIRQTIRGR